MNLRRARLVNEQPPTEGPVVYWMHREHRVRDNWGLVRAQQIARDEDRPLCVAYCLVKSYLDATIRQFGFLLRGLEEVAADLDEKKIPFHLLRGTPAEEIPVFVKRIGAGHVVTDFDSLRHKRAWIYDVGRALPCRLEEVDSRNIVPCWIASQKQEYAARTIRPKIHEKLAEFLENFPGVRTQEIAWPHDPPSNDFTKARESLEVDRDVPEVDWLSPGENAARDVLDAFIAERLPRYDADRNDPGKDVQSNLSPYLHFGMISSARVAMAVRDSGASADNRDGFLEELIVRRELSDNFCYYRPDYDAVSCFPDWAATTLAEHADDEREHLYDRDQLEHARTHDDIWNAAQMEMVRRGKMHGYLRMYWAKKILEWTDSPETAMAHAVYLNDRYELDGRDANGYVGVAWSIGGVHDRAFAERPIFGKIRFMSGKSTARKFKMDGYIAEHLGDREEAE
jgi:deoxyribodipyrimidine photo-lyase